MASLDWISLRCLPLRMESLLFSLNYLFPCIPFLKLLFTLRQRKREHHNRSSMVGEPSVGFNCADSSAFICTIQKGLVVQVAP